MKTPHQDIIDIVAIHRHWCDFWGNGGWAHGDAARLLSESHLEWLVSLAECLSLWIRKNTNKNLTSGGLILAWTNLGSLLEGSMKFFLSVYKHDYDQTPVNGRKQKPADPDELTLERLRQFYAKYIWKDSQKRDWNDWVGQIRDRRNAIHAYQDRDLGSFSDYKESINYYLHFVLELEDHIPYPDEEYAYPLTVYEILERVRYANH